MTLLMDFGTKKFIFLTVSSNVFNSVPMSKQSAGLLIITLCISISAMFQMSTYSQKVSPVESFQKAHVLEYFCLIQETWTDKETQVQNVLENE